MEAATSRPSRTIKMARASESKSNIAPSRCTCFGDFSTNPEKPPAAAAASHASTCCWTASADSSFFMKRLLSLGMHSRPGRLATVRFKRLVPLWPQPTTNTRLGRGEALAPAVPEAAPACAAVPCPAPAAPGWTCVSTCQQQSGLVAPTKCAVAGGSWLHRLGPALPHLASPGPAPPHLPAHRKAMLAALRPS